jgi:hypothetical protein
MKRMVSVYGAILLLALCNSAWSGEREKQVPIGYPFSSWGEISQTPVGREETGVKIDGYVEQGIDWFKIGKIDLKVNTFLAFRETVSSRQEDFFNNKIGPWAGIKFKKTLDLGRDTTASFNLGVRWEHYRYLGSIFPKNENRMTVSMEWGFDGDWKRH